MEKLNFTFYFNLAHLNSHTASGYHRGQGSSNMCEEFMTMD